ncbi:MAG: molybdopterin converting factor subunit 1 [Verrucomicrobiaceae bacterium]|nr:molybdopterin converting factor subunit 1 [Verrucomicrobiaceae bacterium]
MLTVLFFARIREQLGESRLQCAHVSSIDTLIDTLSLRGEQWSPVLRAPNVIVAINQAVARAGQLLCDGDEVAFYPPVTGG